MTVPAPSHTTWSFEFRPPFVRPIQRVKLVYFGIAHSPGRSDPKREPVFAMQP
jgi:hypothetical protein